MDRRAEKYAELIIKTGVNIQKGQSLVITSPVDAAEFARLCVKAAYAAGCKEVHMRWTDDVISRETYLNAEDSVFDVCRPWRADMMNTLSEEGAAFLSIYSEDPEALSCVDPGRISRASAAYGKAAKPFRDRQMADICQWCVVSVPNMAWAKKVFPDKTEQDAVNALWDTIYETVRVTEDNDPQEAWAKHNASFAVRKERMNDYNFKYLKFSNSLGTDLTVELPKGHFWEGGSSTSASGVLFNANMPTEEIFTAPKKDGVNGIVFAAKPLVINGSIAEDFSFVIKDGKIVEINAKTGKDILKSATSVDEGASFLGEVALVQYDSPISNSGILFYNTLFDENAACHLAFGDSYPCIRGGASMTDEERGAHGLNRSIMHEDFMIGTSDLSIIGVTQDGEEVPVFIDGNFVF